MRLLVRGHGLAGEPRLRSAIAGLAGRGHRVAVVGADPEPGCESIAEREVAAGAWEGVIGAGAVTGIAALGRRAAVRAMVVAADAAVLARMGWADRMAWTSLTAFVLIDESDATAARDGAHGVPLEHFVLWPGGTPSEGPATTRPETEMVERAAERALARSLGPAPRAALFVDRDGTLIVEHGYLGDPAGVELLPGVAQALREARTAGHPVVVISNQAGVGRGRFSLADAYAVMAELRRRLRAAGVELDSVRFCPHAPEDGCHCRKPGTLLFERAAEDLQIHLPHSFMVGDKQLDAEAGRRAGMVGAIVASGYGGEEPGVPPLTPSALRSPDLLSAVRGFLAREEARVIG